MTLRFAQDNEISYLVMTRPSEIADSFNAIVPPPNQATFLNRCEYDTFKIKLGSATDKLVTISTSSATYCQGASHGYEYELGNTIVMQPKPHLIVAEDLFLPSAPWQEQLAEWCVHNVKAERELDAEQEAEVRKAAVEPQNWVVTPETLNINLGYLDGTAFPMVDADVAWKHLDGLLIADLPFTPQ